MTSSGIFILRLVALILSIKVSNRFPSPKYKHAKVKCQLHFLMLLHLSVSHRFEISLTRYYYYVKH